jgi:hypothetical protein
MADKEKQYAPSFTIPGRLRYHTVTAQKAFESATRADSKLPKGMQPKAVENAQASVTMLLGKSTFQNLITDRFKEAADHWESEGKLDPANRKAFEEYLKGDVTVDPKHSFSAFVFKGVDDLGVPDDEVAKYPAAVVLKQWAGRDITVLAKVTDDAQLKTQNWDGKQELFPIEETIFEIEPGDLVEARNVTMGVLNGSSKPTLNLTFNTLVLVRKGTRLGGGGTTEAAEEAAFDEL